MTVRQLFRGQSRLNVTVRTKCARQTSFPFRLAPAIRLREPRSVFRYFRVATRFMTTQIAAVGYRGIAKNRRRVVTLWTLYYWFLINKASTPTLLTT